MKARISIIAAISENRALGKDNKLLWHIPEDLKRFKELTKGHVVIMGRKTYESIGRPLPNRINVVITRDQNFNTPGVIVAGSLRAGIEKGEGRGGLEGREGLEIFVIGGGQIYEQAMPLADRLYLTIVEGEYEADTFFPDYSEFKKVIEKKEEETGVYKYTFLTLEKK